MTLLHGLAIFAAGFAGGTMNSIAGGGTLVTFPVLIASGMTPLRANATSTFALWPGAASSAWGYRDEIRGAPRRHFLLVLPSLLGGVAGALLLRRTPEALFADLAPFLILFATLLFLLQEPLARRSSARAAGVGPDRSAGIRPDRFAGIRPDRFAGRWLGGALLLQFLAATYGGYFGAGLGIVVLAVLGWLGMTDIHRMNGLKNLFGFCTNVVAALVLGAAGMVHWPSALVMMAGAIAGGYASAGVARRLGRTFARRAVVCIGFVIAIALFVRRA